MLLQKGLAVVAISSNSVVTHPQVCVCDSCQCLLLRLGIFYEVFFDLHFLSQDGPEFMAEDAKVFKYPFPYLYDEVSFVCSMLFLFLFSIVS